MTKTATVIALGLFVSSAAFAADAYDAQRQAPKGETFWDREWKRSRLGESSNGTGGFLKSLNPMPFLKDQQDKYNARKAGGVK